MIVIRPRSTDSLRETHMLQQIEAAQARARALAALASCRQGRRWLVAARWISGISLAWGCYATLAITPWTVFGVAAAGYALGLTFCVEATLDLVEAGAHEGLGGTS